MSLAPALALAFLAAQDVQRGRVLDTVVVTADRVSVSVSSTAAAVTRISGLELSRAPHATLADLLRLAPGYALTDFDGLGFDPHLMVRGFYGGGEAEYVVLLVDGQPQNQLHTGVVAWDALPPAASVEAVELVRGSASALYGDAAVGGVINVITRDAGDGPGPLAAWNLSGGSHDSWRAGGATALELFSLSAGIDRTHGFRRHAERRSARAAAEVKLVARGENRVDLSVRSFWRDFDDPGPLLDSLLVDGRDASDVLFRFDHTDDRSHSLGLNGVTSVSPRARLSGWASLEFRHTDATRTLALAPGFGDTQARVLESRREWGGVQLDVTGSPLPGDDLLTVGADLSRGSSDSRYYPVVTGDRSAYQAASGQRGALQAAGDADRNAAALFAQYNVHPTAALRLSLGARYDWLGDAFDPRVPDSTRRTTTHEALSPKLGLNVRYLSGDRGSGHVYLTASRSFKAPTLDQLFDQRAIPVPFPPFSVTTSNQQLAPQRGGSVEAGVYHHAQLGTGPAALNATLSVYQMDMKDEIDFDVATLRYVNIGRSRHRGAEAGLNLSGLGVTSIFATYTLQAVTARSGTYAGNALKAIPKHSLTGGASVSTGPLDARLILSHARDMYLDDANTVSLPAYTRVDGHLGVRVRGFDLFLEATNLLDAKYSTTGYLDPSGSGRSYFYPSAGRVVQLGVRSGRP